MSLNRPQLYSFIWQILILHLTNNNPLLHVCSLLSYTTFEVTENVWVDLLIRLFFIVHKRCVFITKVLISTQPELNVISGQLFKLLAEIERMIATSARFSTSLPVPELVFRIESIMLIVRVASSLTEVLFSNECWNYPDRVCKCIVRITGTTIMISPCFIQTSCKCPNVLSRDSAISKADTIDIVAIKSCRKIYVGRIECI